MARHSTLNTQHSTIRLTNRQRRVRFNADWLRHIAGVALQNCRDVCGDGRFALRALGEVEVVIVSDRVIARVHEQFMGIAGATDVITFEHGEIVISAETARANAAEFGTTIERELALYTIHGLLHLNGFADATPPDAARMRRVQDRVLKKCLAQIPPP